jgi:hypothetical protein
MAKPGCSNSFAARPESSKQSRSAGGLRGPSYARRKVWGSCGFACKPYSFKRALSVQKLAQGSFWYRAALERTGTHVPWGLGAKKACEQKRSRFGHPRFGAAGQAFSLDLLVLSSTNFPALRNLSVSGHFCLRGQNAFVFTDSNVAAMLDGLPRIISLSLCAGPDLVTIPLGQSLAGRLRTLRLNLKRDPQSAEPASFNLLPILGCRFLEHLEVAGDSIFTFSRHGDAIVSIVTACQHLKSLKIDLWNRDNLPKPEEITSFFESIVAASSQSLTQIDIPSDLHTSSSSVNLLAPLMPFNNKIKSPSCSLSVPRRAFESHIILGWHGLTDLNVELHLGPEPRFKLECPNLRTLKLKSNSIHWIKFVGDHSKLALIELLFQSSGIYKI